MWTRIARKIGMWLVYRGLKMLYRRVDKNNDGALQKKEIKAFVKDVRKYLNKLV